MNDERDEAQRELARSNRELWTFRRISKIGLATHLNGAALGAMLEAICEAAGFPLATIEIYDPARQVMTLAAHLGLSEAEAGKLESAAEDSVSGQVARAGATVVEARIPVRQKPQPGTRRFAARTFLCVPMKVESGVLGALSLGSPEELEIDERAVEWVEGLANHVGGITERKRTAEALRDNAERLRLLVEQMPALLWTTDSDLRFTSSQGAALADLGLQSGQVDGSLMHELGEMSTAVTAHRQALAGESVSYTGSFRGRTFQAHVEPLRDPGGAITGCIGVALDVTGSRQAERKLRGLTETLTSLVEASPLAIVTLDEESRVTLWSPAAERTFGWKAAEVLGQRFPIIPDDKWDEHVALRRRVLEGELFTGLESRRQDKVGSPIDLRISAAPLRDARGQIHGIASFLEDISDRKRAERALWRLASMPEQSPEPLLELDLAGNAVYLNQAARHRFPDLQALGSWHPVLANVAAVLPRFRHGEKRSFSFEVGHEERVYHQMVYYVPDSALVRVFVHDVTEQRRAKELLAHEALHDRLTELPNRAAFLARLGERLRSRSGAHFAVLAIDLDRFKVINDSLGQAAGDQLLASIARRITAGLGEDEMAARLGSDEFAVLLRETPSLADSLRLADKLRQAIGAPLEIAGQEVFPNASIGIVPGESYQEAEPLLRDAHIAMARAKSLGGGHCETFDLTMGSRSLDRLRLENDLRRAIEHDELQMYYQPVVRLSDGAVVAFEALLRWPRKDGTMVPPAEFIPIAEESGLILPLSYWTLAQVCDRLREWGEAGPAVHLNVSGRLFSDPAFLGRVRAALAEVHGGGERLVLEITESVLMANLDLAVETLVQMKALGAGVAIDDFGTGYSSLSYLQRFPVDSLKIDRSFVSKLGERGESPEILRAVLTLARSLGIDVIAEGVETEEQLDHLLAMGCGLAQGYLFSRAVDLETARGLLAGTPIWTRLLPGSKLRTFPTLEEQPGAQLLSRVAS